jgi:uncharacterized protein (TIGR03435 family)
MLQTLLADRCKLKVHFETKELPAYDLVIAKGGRKMKEAPADENVTGLIRDGDPPPSSSLLQAVIFAVSPVSACSIVNVMGLSRLPSFRFVQLASAMIPLS